MTNLLRRVTGPGRVWAAGAAALLSAAVLVQAPRASARAQDKVGGPVSVAEWSREVWGAAAASKTPEFYALLERLPENHTDDAIKSLRAAVDRQKAHADDRVKQRTERQAELRKELGEHAEKGDLGKALISAVELQAICADKTGVLAEPAIDAVITQADAKAHEHEGKGEWLDAQRLFFRLALLYEEDGRYKKDVTRLGDRTALLATYAPRRLHDLRNAQLERDGEKSLPEYNKIGEDWREKLDGIDMLMVKRAILRAAESHVDRAPLTRLIAGGLQAVRTLLTTDDLAETFPGLADAPARDAMLADVDARLLAVGASPKVDSFDLARAMNSVLETNAKTVKVPAEAVLRAFGDGAVAQLDEFSSIIWPDELARFLRTTQGRFQGIGVQIQLDEGRNLKVVTPLEGTPAQRAGIKQNDVIRKVDGESTLGISLLQAVDRITGPAGSNVVISVEREGAEGLLDFALTRAEIPIYTVKGWRRHGAHESDWDWFVDPSHGVGYVRLTQFTEDTTAHLDAAVRDMKAKGLSALILDLRFNPGGLLSQAVSVANRFVDDGVIVSQHDADGALTEAERARKGQATLAGVPVAVLVNEGSASASEIVAGCLQDYAKQGKINAAIVGARSFGKGSVQNIYDLSRGAAIFKLTERYYHLPGGRLIHRRDGATAWGVEPDISVDMLPKQMGDALELRQDADVLALDQAGNVINEATRPDPAKLLTDGIDPQLEVALLLLQTQIVGRTSGQALLAPAAAPHGS